MLHLGMNSKFKFILIPFACSCNSAGRLHLLYPLSNILDSFQWTPGQSRLFARLNFEYRLRLRSQTSNPCYNLAKDNKNIFSRFILPRYRFARNLNYCICKYKVFKLTIAAEFVHHFIPEIQMSDKLILEVYNLKILIAFMCF